MRSRSVVFEPGLSAAAAEKSAAAAEKSAVAAEVAAIVPVRSTTAVTTAC